MALLKQEDRIPVTLLTGFLGAGKTTLLNHLIRDPDAGRVAVIVNEFGDIGLDHDLIEAATEETILMQSGCVCCTFRGDLVETLGRLLSRRSGGELDFDRVVIESTGIADPAPILHSLVVDQTIAPSFRMDGVVTVADAMAGPRTLEAQFEAVHQVALADLIVLSKTDLVAEADLARFEAKIAGINATARQIRAEYGRVSHGALFGLSALRPGASPDDISQWLGEPGLPESAGGNEAPVAAEASKRVVASAQHDAAHARHGHQIASASIEIQDPIPASVFDFWIDTLIAFRGPDILRIKGIVHVEDMEWPFVFHGVQHIFDAPVPLKSWRGGGSTSRVVVIARDFNKADLQASLETLRMRPGDIDAKVEGMLADTAELPL